MLISIPKCFFVFYIIWVLSAHISFKKLDKISYNNKQKKPILSSYLLVIISGEHTYKERKNKKKKNYLNPFSPVYNNKPFYPSVRMTCGNVCSLKKRNGLPFITLLISHVFGYVCLYVCLCMCLCVWY